MIMKQNKEKFDFKAFGQAIKAARKAKGISRNQLADKLNIAPRYIASIENSGQHPSLQILYELVTLLDVSVDQFFFPEREQEKSTRRRQLDTMLDGMSEKELVFDDRSQISIDFTAVENEVADNRFQRSELDYLIYNDPLAYADLILNSKLNVLFEQTDIHGVSLLSEKINSFVSPYRRQEPGR